MRDETYGIAIIGLAAGLYALFALGNFKPSPAPFTTITTTVAVNRSL